jgi:hypothetical protein
MNKDGNKQTAKTTLGETSIPGLKNIQQSDHRIKVNTRYNTRNINKVTLSLEDENLENNSFKNREKNIGCLNTESELEY